MTHQFLDIVLCDFLGDIVMDANPPKLRTIDKSLKLELRSLLWLDFDCEWGETFTYKSIDVSKGPQKAHTTHEISILRTPETTCNLFYKPAGFSREDGWLVSLLQLSLNDYIILERKGTFKSC